MPELTKEMSLRLAKSPETAHSPLANRALPAYEAMDATGLERFRDKVHYVADIVPEAAFIGGAALRIWLDQAGIPVPTEVSGDIDVIVAWGSQPQPDVYDVGPTPDKFTLDVTDTWEPFEEPWFSHPDYEGISLTVSTPQRQLVKKAETYMHESPAHDRWCKDHLYFQILSRLVSREALVLYLEASAGREPNHFRPDPSLINFLTSKKLI